MNTMLTNESVPVYNKILTSDNIKHDLEENPNNSMQNITHMPPKLLKFN